MGYNIFGLTKVKRRKVLLCTLVPLAVVVNNLPIIGLLSGNAYIVKPCWYIAVFAVESLFIGLFEEFAFRGVLLPYILERRRSDAKSIFWATLISSAAFGAVHIFNLFVGAGFGGVILQIGYSFLIGGMCAIVLLYTRCIWLCVALHAIYDFCGFLVPKLGEGVIWDPVTVTLTAVLGVFAFVFMLIWLLRITPERVDELYKK
ncbi:MAG: lysostaphin resistance A-like protein [Eubacteriales bacterium]